MSKKAADAGSGAVYIPTRVLIGHWVHSSEPEPDQHAVYGILSRDGKLRFKLVPETRDGRAVQGNYPPSRETWVIHSEIVFESYLANLNRLGMKEYCRERGRQVEAGEKPGGPDNAANILKAVEKAEYICAAAKNERPRNLRWEREKCADRRRAVRMETWASRRTSGVGGGTGGDGGGGGELADGVLGATPADAGAGVQKKRKKHGERRTVYHHEHVPEAVVAAAAAAAAADSEKHVYVGRDRGRDSMDASTTSSMTDSSAEDTKPKVYNGVVYSRNPTGPFAGKLTAKGQVVSIAGEDYVEYRVLAKV